jgi:glutamate 5-kinase
VIIAKKIVIKIGSSLLVEAGRLRVEWLESFAEDVADLMKKKYQIIIVSSGAIALGRTFIKTNYNTLNYNITHHDKLTLEEKQAAAAIGQIQLMSHYRDCFKQCGFDVAQILLTAADCNSHTRYINAQNTINTLLVSNIIPIINENDSVAVDEIKIGDNDRLAARVAQMSSAEQLILFSDIDGLYNKNPKTNKDAKLIKEVLKITKEIEIMAGSSTSLVGTGGMITKIAAAKMAELAGCETIITNGLDSHSLQKLSTNKQNYTIFRTKEAITSRKKWLSGLLNTGHGVEVNQCTRDALKNKKISLLPIGITKIIGNFKNGETIFIKDEDGNHIASGIANYSASEAKQIIGKNSDEIKKMQHKPTKIELVHIDNLVVL